MYTLVTACMNRESHLRRSLEAWRAIPDIGEILIVDWSNSRPLVDLCGEDPRIRVVRVEGEPRWILSYAYNLGVFRASHPYILKCDSDCLPDPKVVLCLPDEGHFYAGFWKSGAQVGKPSVNGQCVFLRTQFEAINGYSEYIRTYGRDDEDLYDRLIAKGFERREIAPELLNFLDHTQEDRISNQFDLRPNPSFEEVLLRNPAYNEMHNLLVAKALPWSQASARATYETLETGDRWERLRRNRSDELSIPEPVRIAARIYSMRSLVSQLFKIPMAATQDLDEPKCLALLRSRLTGAPKKQP
jgi:hypothetical protein